MSGIEEKAIAVLRAIVQEVAGHEQPYSAYSYLPPHLIHDARQAIEAHEVWRRLCTKEDGHEWD